MESVEKNNQQFLLIFKICLLCCIFMLFFYIIYVNPTSNNNRIKNSYKLNKAIKNTNSNRLFCIIKTTPNSITYNKTLNLYNVWGHKCDNYRFISVIPPEYKNPIYNLKNNSNNVEVEIPFHVLQPNGLVVDKYTNITEKVFSAMKYIYKNFPIFDWYLIVDDDAYINMENLHLFLKDKDPNRPVTYGHDFNIIVDRGYHSGGCGYLLSKESFVRLTQKLITNLTFCSDSGIDDVDINSCLRRLNVLPNSTLDELKRERFFPVHFVGYYIGPVPDWLKSYSLNPPVQGLNCCSDTAIGFHYMNPRDMIRLDNAFKIQKYQHQLLKEQGFLNTKIKFKDVAETYILLEKIEKNMD